MKRFVKYFVIIFWVFLPNILTFPQSQKDMAAQKKKDQSKIDQMKKDIEYTNKLLGQTKEKKVVSLNQLVTLNKEINMREELIGEINNEMVDIDQEMIHTNLMIDALEKDMKALKDEYAKMIYFAYKNKNSYSRLMFIFASKDFNQAYKRIKYFQQYTEYRKKQKDMIVATQKVLMDKMTEMETKKAEKSGLLTNSQTEKNTLDNEKDEQLTVLNSLQSQEKKLKADLKEKQIAADKLNAAIEDIIRKEIDLARKSSESTGVKNPVNTSTYNLTPEAQIISTSFAGNQGKLPWPVERGVITETFGTHPHASLKGIMVKSDGIEISCQKGSEALAVFDGVVSGVVIIPGAQKAIIVRHGDYLTVYSNLEETYIKMGDKVTRKQKIGLIHTNDEDAKTNLDFQIWKGTVKLDPSSWIARK